MFSVGGVLAVASVIPCGVSLLKEDTRLVLLVCSWPKGRHPKSPLPSWFLQQRLPTASCYVQLCQARGSLSDQLVVAAVLANSLLPCPVVSSPALPVGTDVMQLAKG